MYDTALQAACTRGKLENVKLLLESGADPNIQGENTACAFHVLHGLTEFQAATMARHCRLPLPLEG
jgi:ankyrin repeat protein